jgi:hypothetical protein
MNSILFFNSVNLISPNFFPRSVGVISSSLPVSSSSEFSESASAPDDAAGGASFRGLITSIVCSWGFDSGFFVELGADL